MPTKDEISLMAHLMRRAGFGAPYAELEARAAKGYEATVEELLHPESQPPIDDDLLYRFFPALEGALNPTANQSEWVYRMVNTQRPLEEKMALFWHQLVRHRQLQGGQSTGDYPADQDVPAARSWASSTTCWWSWPRTRQ